MEEFECCIWFGELYSPIILNSGTILCADKVSKCPETNIEIQQKFTIKKLLKPSDRITYMNQFDKIELDDPKNLTSNC